MKEYFIKNLFKRDKEKIDIGIKKTKSSFSQKIKDLFIRNSKINEDVIEELEEILINSDVGVDTSLKIIDSLKTKISKNGYKEDYEIIISLKEVISEILSNNSKCVNEIDEWIVNQNSPYVIMVVGINGVGKTTTIAKMANKFKNEGKKVMIGACDTFRVAAIEQLDYWAKKLDVPITKQNINSDPASVSYDTLQSAKSKKIDVVIIDTAGRLHNNLGLMNELNKIKNVMKKIFTYAPNETMLVIDSSTGQNAFEQVSQFSKIIDIDSISVTKLDGTAKGGVLIGITDKFNIPIRYVGMGEKIEDIFVFNKNLYIDSLFS